MVYVDYDPVVVSHGRALLTVSDLSIMVQGDLRRPADLLALPEVRAHLDFGRPVAIGLLATLHFVPDAVAPGSYLAISHIGTEFFPDQAAMAQAKAVYERASEPVWARSRDQILGFFDGFELLEPGLVPKRQWRSVTGQAAADTPNIQWGGVGRKH